MLWEHNSTIVVMLTKLREMGRVSVFSWDIHTTKKWRFHFNNPRASVISCKGRVLQTHSGPFITLVLVFNLQNHSKFFNLCVLKNVLVFWFQCGMIMGTKKQIPLFDLGPNSRHRLFSFHLGQAGVSWAHAPSFLCEKKLDFLSSVRQILTCPPSTACWIAC